MKVAIVFILLTTTREKEACKDSNSHSGRHGRPITSGSFDAPNYGSITPSDRQARARLFEIPVEERQWKKDHQIVLSADTAQLSAWTKLDASVVELKTILEKNPFRNQGEVDNTFRDPEECVDVATYAEHYSKIKKKPLPTKNSWDRFFAHTSNCHMYRGNSDEIIQTLLDDMFNLNVTSVENFGGKEDEGTQIKLKVTFKNGKKAIFKPMRFGIDYEKDPDQFYHGEMERPNAEIAAFHLDKLLNFRRAIPTVGRSFSMKMLKKRTKKKDEMKFFESPGKNLCFVGTCKQYCDTEHAVCAVDDQVRGSVQAWMPSTIEFDQTRKKPELYLDFDENPYKRTYGIEENADWQGPKNVDYCKKNVTKKPEFAIGRRLMDLVDLSVLDFFTGNQDRHSFDSFYDFYDRNLYPGRVDVSFIIHLDNGRGFGNPHVDDMDILAALTQCCVVRPSTAEALLKFYKVGTSLATELDAAMRQFDPTHPILAPKYLVAIDRRHEIVLKEIAKCVDKTKTLFHLRKPQVHEVLMNNFGGKPRFAVQQGTSMGLMKRGDRFNQRPVDIETMAQEMHRTILLRTDHSERKERGDQLNQRRGVTGRIGGNSGNIDAVTDHQETDDALPRPPQNDSLVQFLMEKLPENPAEYVSCPNEKTHQEYLTENSLELAESVPWLDFYNDISTCHLYKTESRVVEDMLRRRRDIQKVVQESSQQLSVIVTFIGFEEKAVFKPMRFDRNYETNPNHFYFDDFERAHAEIAAFHLDRLLGFRRVPPTVAQAFYIHDQLIQKQVKFRNEPIARMARFSSPAGKECFCSWRCRKYCHIEHAFCGKQEEDSEKWLIDGSIQIWTSELREGFTESPYKKTFSTQDYTIQSTRTDDEYCNRVLKKQVPYNNGRLLLDLVELHIFDYLTGNQDRNNFHLFTFMDNKMGEPYIFVRDNAKAFGNPRDDDSTILAPLTQCCVVRPSTVKMLLDFYTADVSLGQQLDESLKDEGKFYPILAKKYLIAINRRVEIVLQEVRRCLLNAMKGDPKTVLMNSFHYKRPLLPWFRGFIANDDSSGHL